MSSLGVALLHIILEFELVNSGFVSASSVARPTFLDALLHHRAGSCRFHMFPTWYLHLPEVCK